MAQNIVTQEALSAAIDMIAYHVRKYMIVLPPDKVEEHAIGGGSANGGDGEEPHLFLGLPPDMRFSWPRSNPGSIPAIAQELAKVWEISTASAASVAEEYKVVIRSGLSPNCAVVLRVAQVIGIKVLFYPFLHPNGTDMVFPSMIRTVVGASNVVDLTFTIKNQYAPSDGSLYGLKNGGLVEICTADQILLGMNRSSVATASASPANAEAPGIMMLSSDMTEADSLDAATSEPNVDSIEPNVDSIEPDVDSLEGNVDSLQNTEPNNTEEYE